MTYFTYCLQHISVYGMCVVASPNHCWCCCVSGNTSDPCGCPDGFRRYGTRCLLVLDQLIEDWWDAVMACWKFDAKLAVPRSEAENELLKLAAIQLQAEPVQRVWLGIQRWSGKWICYDSCGPIQHYFWATGQPVPDNTSDYVALEPQGMASGWYGVPETSGPYRPLCQLSSCFRPDCPQT